MFNPVLREDSQNGRGGTIQNPAEFWSLDCQNSGGAVISSDVVVLPGQLSNPNPQGRKLLDSLAADEGDRILVRVVKTAKARQVQRRLKPAEIEKLVLARQQGTTINELATEFKIHRTTVIAHLKKPTS